MAEGAGDARTPCSRCWRTWRWTQGGEGGGRAADAGVNRPWKACRTRSATSRISVTNAFRELQDRLNPNRPQQGQQQGEQGQQGPAGSAGPAGPARSTGGSNPEKQQGQGQARPAAARRRRSGWAPPKGRAQGGENGEGMTLSQRQEALRRLLEQQQSRLPGTGTEAGDEAQRQLDRAGPRDGTGRGSPRGG